MDARKGSRDSDSAALPAAESGIDRQRPGPQQLQRAQRMERPVRPRLVREAPARRAAHDVERRHPLRGGQRGGERGRQRGQRRRDVPPAGGRARFRAIAVRTTAAAARPVYADMSGEPARNCAATAAPSDDARGARPAGRPAGCAAATTHGIQAAPAKWFHMLTSERSGPEAIHTIDATRAPGGDTPRLRARANMPRPAQARWPTAYSRVVRPGPHQQVEPGRRVVDLGVGVGQQRLAEADPRVPRRPRAGGHAAHEALHLRVPEQMDVALEEHAAAEDGSRGRGRGARSGPTATSARSREPGATFTACAP